MRGAFLTSGASTPCNHTATVPSTTWTPHGRGTTGWSHSDLRVCDGNISFPMMEKATGEAAILALIWANREELSEKKSGR